MVVPITGPAARRQTASTENAAAPRLAPGDVVTALGALAALATAAFSWFTIHLDFGALYNQTIDLRAWDYTGGIVALVSALLALLLVVTMALRVRLPLPAPVGAHYVFLGALGAAGAGVYLMRANAVLAGHVAGIVSTPTPALYIAFGGAALTIAGGVISLVMHR